MNTRFQIKFIFAVCLPLFIGAVYGHDIPVHQAITFNAAQTAHESSPAYISFIDAISSDLPYAGPLGVTNATIDGSGFEDNIDVPGDIGKKRSLNHFYDPLDHTYYKGLSDSLGFKNFLLNGDKRVLVGTNSFAWAAISNGVGVDFAGERFTFWHIAANKDSKNIWSWQNARGYEWLGLTATNQVERQTNLGNMFRAVGQVMHLLEDTSQPQHARNEQHADPFDADSWAEQHDPWASPIEIYGNEHASQLNYQHDILDWRTVGFTKLEDFWDRHLYNGNSAALKADLSGGSKTLGLAEFVNGNFLGDRHTYAEYFHPGDIEYYPFPSVISGTDFRRWAPSRTIHGAYIDTEYLKNGVSGNRVYLTKSGDGISVQHHSVLTYTGVKIPLSLSTRVRQVSSSIRSTNVLHDYLDILIPKAVKYSAGLLDYYFRGTLEAYSVGSDPATLHYTNEMVNTSGQNFYGGSFSLYQDDTNGVRHFIARTNFTDKKLLAGATMVWKFTSPMILSNPHFIVYQGTIGITNDNQPLDPVDAGIAIAAAKVEAEPIIFDLTWDQLAAELDLYLTDPHGVTLYEVGEINIASDDCVVVGGDDEPGNGKQRMTLSHFKDGNYILWVNNENNPGDPAINATLVTSDRLLGLGPTTNTFVLQTAASGQNGYGWPVGFTGPGAVDTNGVPSTNNASWYVRKTITIQDGKLVSY